MFVIFNIIFFIGKVVFWFLENHYCYGSFDYINFLFWKVGLLDEEKILPLGKEITAVGICRWQDGVPEIRSCRDLPYFL